MIVSDLRYSYGMCLSPEFLLKFVMLVACNFAALRILLRDLALEDKRTLLVSFLYLAFVESSLVTSDQNFKKLANLCQARFTRSRGLYKADSHATSLDQRAWGISVAKACFPEAKCLTEAIALCLRLTALGLPAVLVVGTRCDEFGGLMAHAWVELGAEPICQSHPDIESFTTILHTGSPW